MIVFSIPVDTRVKSPIGSSFFDTHSTHGHPIMVRPVLSLWKGIEPWSGGGGLAFYVGIPFSVKSRFLGARVYMVLVV